ncbi:ParB N-terminal domain-containing protein [Plantibacter sp. CFBP 8798]|uniref:ParB N-terminal domain-containing protein n=1 Tax=Plantibacter sp. CFBP 8798 TaxID=2775268 RepID=UPI001781741C|nr:ParB N-terminal domain-containing protein [Plantibacter sp. CFBP 8798]MBD8467057.1 ParB N-terminal domain-containing protein [Plantibacter sp. CFBP 8798]
MVTFDTTTVPLKNILLDPNNFRFTEPGSVALVAEARIAEDKVQAAALEKVKADGVSELKLSISENGFVPVERIVVRALDGDANNYVVVEGNRRTAALKLLERDHAGGVDLGAHVSAVFAGVPVLLATDASEDDLLAIMGIRHVGGPKEWGGYQSALLVYRLISKPDLTAREVASRLGLTVNEVNRRNRAFSALTQMMEDEEYGEFVTPEMYPIFHETVGQPLVREWLGWSQTERTFNNEDNRELFYGWLTRGEDGPKLRSYSEIRELKLILENDDALVALKDDDQSFSDALAIVRTEARSARWLPNAKSALASLNEMGSDTIESLDAESLTVLAALRRKAAWIVKAHAVSQDDSANDEA